MARTSARWAATTRPAPAISRCVSNQATMGCTRSLLEPPALRLALSGRGGRAADPVRPFLARPARALLGHHRVPVLSMAAVGGAGPPRWPSAAVGSLAGQRCAAPGELSDCGALS